MSYEFIAIIPAFNPGPVVIDVVGKTLGFVNKIVLINDGSDDQNTHYLEQCVAIDNSRVELLTFNKNMGKGFALLKGMERCLELNCDYILTIDSDGQHNPDEIAQLKELILRDDKPYEIVIGARKQLDKMPLRSKLGNVFVAKVFNSLFSADLPDTQSGFRILSAKIAKDALKHIPQGKYETEMHMLLYAFENDRKVGSLEIETIYLDENANSKFRPIRDSLRVLATFMKYVSVAFVSFLIDYLIFLVLTYAFGIYFLYAHLSSRIFSGTLNFLLNKHLVFKSDKSHGKQAVKYLFAVMLALIATSSILYALVEVSGLTRALAKPIAELLVFILNFFVLRKIVFS